MGGGDHRPVFVLTERSVPTRTPLESLGSRRRSYTARLAVRHLLGCPCRYHRYRRATPPRGR